MPVPRLRGKYDPDHYVFPTPPHDEVIWRYMDFAKFVALLDRQALYCASIASFPDRFEGSSTEATMVAAVEQNPDIPDFATTLRNMYGYARTTSYANCWNRDDAESVALWSMYTSPSGGVAIRSSIGSLLNALSAEADDTDEEAVYVGPVQYIDYANTVIPVDNAMWPLVHKRRAYRFEQEVRLVAVPHLLTTRRLTEMYGPSTEESPHTMAQRRQVSPPGYDVAIDVAALIDEVVLAPEAPAWLAELVTATCARFGLEVPVRRSDLDALPTYRAID